MTRSARGVRDAKQRDEVSRGPNAWDAALQREIVECRRCPRLVKWREEVARVKRAAYRDQEYWGRPVPGFGDPKAKLVIVGLAPGAHGANRTGRMFTGDRSGLFLYAGLHRAGFASAPESISRDDGLKLRNAFITAPVRCVPPENMPTPAEIAACRPFLTRELELLKPKVFLALGAIAWNAILEHLDWPRPRPKFAHGAQLDTAARRGAESAAAVTSSPRETSGHEARIVGCYHVSQQNTQTGRLTPKMFDDVMKQVRGLL